MKHFFDLNRLNRIDTPAICRPAWCLLLAAGLACLPAVGRAQAGEPAIAAVAVSAGAPGKAGTRSYSVVGYNRAIKQSDFDGLSKATVLQLQQQLHAIYLHLPDWQSDYAMKEQPLNDGIVGRITLSWLQRYGYNFKIKVDPGYAQALAGHVNRIAAFGAAHPAELSVLLGEEFDDWAEDQPDTIKGKDYAIRRQAGQTELLALVARYLASRAMAPRAVETTADSGGYFTYRLRQADLDLLHKGQLFTMLDTLKDRPFRTQAEFKMGLLQALGGRDQLLNAIWPAVWGSVRDSHGYLINETSLKRLEKNTALKNPDQLDEDEKQPTTPIERLRSLGTVYSPSRDAFDKLIERQNTDNQLALTEVQRTALAKGTRVFSDYHLDQQALATIQNQLKNNVLGVGVPEALVRMLEQIKDVDYSEVSVFRSAVISKIDFGLGMCRQNSPSNNKYVTDLRIADGALAELQKQLEVLQQQPLVGSKQAMLDWGATFSDIAMLRARADVCDPTTDGAAKQRVRDIYQNYLWLAIENVARKKLPDKIVAPKIKGGPCGCTVDGLAQINYAFYPYWNSQDKPMEINFRPLDRVAFLGLTIDNVGELMLGDVNFAMKKDADVPGFVRTAHQYNSKVDWVIQKNDWDGDWKTLSARSKQAVFAKLGSNILALLTDSSTGLRAYTQSRLEANRRRGDGVTLYFPNYPDDVESATLFNTFFRDLRHQLAAQQLGLNVLVSQNVFAAGKNDDPRAFGLSNLIALGKELPTSDAGSKSAADIDEFVLVLLNEPSSNAKKMLRADIEGNASLHGAERANFLRRVLPVLHFDNHNWQQLEDDIVYARDNFGGLGFWAPDFANLAKPVADPGASCVQSEGISACLLRDYTKPGEDISMPSQFSITACVQRWMLRPIMGTLLLLWLALGIAYLLNCRVQNFLKQHWNVLALLGGLTALAVLVMLRFDPLMLTLAPTTLAFLFGAVVLVGVGGWIYYRWLNRRGVPERERDTVTSQDTGFPIVVWHMEMNKHGFQWIVRNRGSGYAVIKRLVIMLDKQPFADIQAALASVLQSDSTLQWKSVPVNGTRLAAGKNFPALTITDPESIKAVQDLLQRHQLAVQIIYGGAGNEDWVSDGKEVRSIYAL